MNRRIIIVIVILGIIVSLFTIVTIIMKQNGSYEVTKQNENPVIKENGSSPNPEERVIASFGLNQQQQVLRDNPALIDTLINVSDADIAPYQYPKGPVIGYGKDMKGSIVVMMDENQTVNQTLITEIYDRISARGKMYNITSVPCKFISMGIINLDIAKDTMP
jgi:uncharacterized membrane protein